MFVYISIYDYIWQIAYALYLTTRIFVFLCKKFVLDSFYGYVPHLGQICHHPVRSGIYGLASSKFMRPRCAMFFFLGGVVSRDGLGLGRIGAPGYRAALCSHDAFVQGY